MSDHFPSYKWRDPDTEVILTRFDLPFAIRIVFYWPSFVGKECLDLVWNYPGEKNTPSVLAVQNDQAVHKLS